MKTIILAALMLCLAACDMPQQPLTKPAANASYAPMPSRGAHGTEDFSRMDNSMEVTPCGYTSMFLYKCHTP